MAIYKTVITFTVLSDTPVDELSLEEVLHECKYGESIGQSEWGETQAVPPEQVKQELLALGNDGTFFGED